MKAKRIEETFSVSYEIHELKHFGNPSCIVQPSSYPYNPHMARLMRRIRKGGQTCRSWATI